VPAPSMTLGASWSSPHCPVCKSARAFATPLHAARSNEIGDELYECRACGYEAVYRVRTGHFEPRKEEISEPWQSPLMWPLPRTIDSVQPAANRPTESAVPTVTGIDSHEDRGHRHRQPVVAGVAPQSRAANSPKTAQGSTHELASASPGKPLATEPAREPSGDASLDAPADFRKPPRTIAPDQPRSQGRGTRRHQDRLRSRPAGETAATRTDRAKGRGTDAGDATRNRSRKRQGQPGGPIVSSTTEIYRVLAEQIDKLRADPDLDPVRKAQAIAQLTADVVALIEQFEKLPLGPDLAEAKAQQIDQFCANVHRVLTEQMETLRANPDVDPGKRARAIARFTSEERRLRDLHFRRVGQARPHLFDLAAVLTQGLEENTPKIEAMKAAAERAANERNGRAEDPTSGDS